MKTLKNPKLHHCPPLLPNNDDEYGETDMPPPQLAPRMREIMGQLRQQIEAQAIAAKQDDAIQQRKTAARNRIQTDYAVLIREWYSSIPPAARQRRYTTEELLTKFAGRYRDRPAVRMIGAALRVNGFLPRRDWSVAGRNLRYWVPPPD